MLTVATMFSTLAVLSLFFALSTSQEVTSGSNCNFNDGRCAYHVTLAPSGSCGSPPQQDPMPAADGGCPAQCLQVETDLQATKIDFLSKLVKTKDQILSSDKRVNDTTTRLGKHDKAISDTFIIVQRQARDIQGLGSKINGLENTVFALADANKKLEEKFDYFMSVLNGTREELDRKTEELKETVKERDSLLKEFGIKEGIYNQTVTQLQQTTNMLTDALATKGKEMRVMAAELQTCRSSATAKCGAPPAVPQRDYKVTRCDFETSDNCRYQQDQTDNVDWTRGKGNRGNGGPTFDGTYGTLEGYYMYINPEDRISSSTRNTRIARLISPVLESDGSGYCLAFYYYMNGQSQSTLSVYAKVDGGLGYPIWSASGDQGTEWKLARLDISAEYTYKNFSVVFEGRVASYYTYYQASRKTYYRMEFPSLDAIQVINRPCSSVSTCPAGSIQMKGNPTSCFSFVTTPLSWYKAIDHCKNISQFGHLIAIRSKEVQDFVIDTVKNNNALSTANALGWFTSGNDEAREKTFVWTSYNNDKIGDQGFQKWTVGQPNNVAGNQHCLLMEKAPEMTWGDVDCNSLHPFICEFQELNSV